MTKKLLFAAAGLSLLVASPAFAQHVYNPAPSPAVNSDLYGPAGGYALSGSYAQAPNDYVQGRNGYDRGYAVIPGNHPNGGDPDANVRTQLNRDSFWSGQEQF